MTGAILSAPHLSSRRPGPEAAQPV